MLDLDLAGTLATSLTPPAALCNGLWYSACVLALSLTAAVVRVYYTQCNALATNAAIRVPPLTSYPPVAIIRPCRGLDQEMAVNVLAGIAIARAYPNSTETIFVFDEETDPGLAEVRRVLEEEKKNKEW